MVPATRNNVTMTPWTAPINRLDGLFDRLLDDAFFGFGAPRAAEAVMPISLWHDEDHIYVEADLPGMAEQDLEVIIHKGVLSIRGERKPEPGRQYLYNGRGWGRFERTITLPEEVNADDVRAELAQGVLRLTLSKSPAAKPRKIALKSS
jgi:HSP20 family protein